ncbi:MAG: tryptophan 7-halogenase [Proteobacteria bacterium]|jgi:glycine/D-amino acid oxidase-like deaminating enzyme|nr:tryptophan halogenase [Methylibium sp.]MBY0365910.1 tryptophan 7-halogenase [Burkholderiaceae bacterium]MCH8855679.1 tryptophan 7-halogenase [Pseudomonadota bacterium]
MTDTATVFNQHVAARPASGTSLAPPPIEHVCVVGGGTAGWMTALMLATSAYGPRLKVSVLESPQVGIIGVGEGSTPWLRGFFDGLGIEESEWMPACNATYKAGITFEGWSTRPGFERYFHPFASMLDNMTMHPFVDNVHARLDGADVYAHPDRFFVAAALARQGRGPRARADFPFDVWYGYHFDATLLGQFLARKAVERGVSHLQRHVHRVQLNEAGDIASLLLDDGQALSADFFIDCTGFSSLLIGEALGTPFIPFAENLFNDAAIAMPTPLDGPIPSQTVSTALRHGWAWKIPLTTRCGNGYVYSSAHCSADEAETELRRHLGLLDADVPARHLKMRVGRMTQIWNRNCVAVGLSQGFIEPLEATALLFVQRTAAAFVSALEQGNLSPAARQRFNDEMATRFENTRDYIVAHYKTNSRTDTEYWRANADNMQLSDSLQGVLMTWLSRKPLAAGLKAGRFGAGYPIVSWYALLAGMGILPDASEMRPPTPHEARHRLDAVDDFVARSARNFPDHRDLLAHIPPRVGDKTLQLYLW